MAKKIGCSTKVVDRIIHEDLGLATRKKAVLHQLNDRQIQIRKTNARKLSREHVRPENYEFLVTLDEAWLYSDETDAPNPLCYLKRGENIENQAVLKQRELGGKKVMVVGILTGRGPIPLKFVQKNVKINSIYYCNEVLIPLVKKWLPELYPEALEKVFIHHDAATSHTSRYTTEVMKSLADDHQITFIDKEDIPIKSPDASPLDFFGFGHLKHQLKSRRPTIIQGLRKIASRLWMEIDSELIKKVFDSWHRRLLQIEYKSGHHIEHTKKIHRKRVQ